VSSWEQKVTRVLDALRLDSIKNRILALALLATLIPALTTAVLSYRQNRRSLTDRIDSELRRIVSQTAREIDLWVDQRSYEVRVFTGSFEVTENLARIPRGGAVASEAEARLTDYLNGVYARSRDYAGLLVTDVYSTPMASTGRAQVSLNALPSDWLARVQRGEAVISPPYTDARVGQVVATLAVPIEAGPLEFVGSLAATMTFASADSIMAGFQPVGGGRVQLVTGNGTVIAASDAAGQGIAVPSQILDMLSDAGGTAVEYTGDGGAHMVGAMTELPGLDWSVVAQVPADEAYAEVTRLRNSAFLLVSLILVVVGGIAYLLGVVIVRPLARLTEGAGAVAGGDLSVDLPKAGRGEVGYLTDVFNEMVGRLRRSREELDERNRELERLSVTDLLTGLHNRRYLLDAFDKEIRRADRHERPFCVLMMDVDRFKQYNDTHGHLAGDEVLKGMGRVLRDAMRDLDVTARYGGEEFICLLPECDAPHAVLAAERVRSRLAQERFAGGPITISIGVAEFPTHGDTAGEVIGAADAALYEAKAAGRDQVKSAPPKPKEEHQSKATKRSAKARTKRGAEKSTSESPPRAKTKKKAAD